jgi:phage FluMu protein Com
MAKLSPERAAALIEHIVSGTAATLLDACCNLVARAAASASRIHLLGAATALAEALAGDPARVPPRDPWQRDPGIKSGVVVDLLSGLLTIDPALAERAADHMLAWPTSYGFDRVLVPAVQCLMDTAKDAPAVKQLRSACVDHLRRRVAEPLQAPRDWRRASVIGCKCPRCAELSAFLDSAERPTWIFKAAEFDRRHVEETIRKARCDLDVATDRHGRPYSLVCTKNQNSYDRRVKQRAKDLLDLEQLGA